MTLDLTRTHEPSDFPPPYGAAAFDCDSTLSAMEGIDELALDFPAAAEKIRKLTDDAMAGRIRVEDVYRARLELLKPDRASVLALGQRYIDRQVSHAKELIAALHELGKPVHIVTGGILQAVLPFARELAVPARRVHAVRLDFDERGAYRGFDESSPLATSLGKLEVARRIADEVGAGGVVFIGDGVTDLAAAPAARRFVAFSGVVRREEVEKRSAVACERADFAALIPLLLSPGEIARLARSPNSAALVRAFTQVR